MNMPNENSGMPSVNESELTGPMAMVPATTASAHGLVPAPFSQGAVVELAPPSVLSAPPTPMALLVALKRRWLLAVVLGVIGAVAGTLGAWHFFPITWRASTMLQISSSRPVVFFADSQERVDFGNYQRSQVVLVKSRLVLNAALRDPEVAALPLVQEKVDPIEWLVKKLQVDFGSGAEIMTIAMNGDHPEALTKVVNAVRDAYVKEIVNSEQSSRLKRLDQLQKLWAKYDNLSRDKSNELKKLKEDYGHVKTNGTEHQQKMFYERLGDAHRELFQKQSRIQQLQIELKLVQAKLEEIKSTRVPEATVEDRLSQHPDIMKLEATITEKQAVVERLKLRLVKAESDPIYIAENATLNATKENLETRRKNLRELVLKQLKEESLARTTLSEQSKNEELKMLKEFEKMLEDEVKRKSKHVDTLNKGTIEVEWLDDELAYNREVLKKVGTQKENLQVELDAPSRVKLIEEAYAVKTRDEASRVTTAGMTGLGMFGLCILGVSFLEFRARRVSGFSEVAYGLGLKIVGVLPQVPVRALGHKTDKSPDNWQHILTESIASTRTMLIHAAKNEALRVVMVSSAMKGEGKTLVSSHLAVSMALAGFKTLLIDADLRCPSLHRLFDLPQSPGLSDLLRAQARSKKVLHSGKVPGLTIMTAGQWDNALVQLLAQQRVGEVLAVLRKSYDFIIIDSAPILAASDTSLIAQHTDGVLLSVLCDVSRLPMVHLAYERMAMLGVRTLGAVVGGANLDSYGYGYGYGQPTSSPI